MTAGDLSEEREELARQADRLAAGNAEAAALGEQLRVTFERLIEQTGIPSSINRLSVGVAALFLAVIVSAVAIVVAGLGARRASEAAQRANEAVEQVEVVAHASAIQTCEYVNDKALGPLVGLLSLAKSTASRNPLPPGLSDEQRAFYEAQRAQAGQFYDDAGRLASPQDCAAAVAQIERQAQGGNP